MTDKKPAMLKGAGAEPDNGPNQLAPISFGKDIVPLFTPKDITCMKGFGVLLDDYSYMSDPTGDAMHSDHANAKHVYFRLTGDEQPQMPKGGEKKWNAPDNPEGRKNLEILDVWMRVDPTYQP